MMSSPAANSSAMAASASGSKRAFPGNAADADADERRVQPRHFHARPNSTPAATEASSQQQQQRRGSGGASPVPAARLYRHALESIFAFLGRDELVAALQVSKEWLGAVKTMRRLQLTVKQPAVRLWFIAASTMGRHVATLGRDGQLVTLDGDDLFILVNKMAHLRGLHCRLVPPPAHLSFIFPRALVELTLRIDASVHAAGSSAAADTNAVIRSVGRLAQLEKLTLKLPAWDARLSFAPLSGVALPQLTAFEIRLGEEPWGAPVNISNAQIDELRAMPQLRQLLLDRDCMNFELLALLLRQPHSLQWQDVTALAIDDEVGALLGQLPSLTRIDEWIICARFEWLQQLPNLRHATLSLYPFQRQADCDVDSLVAGLQHCTKIEFLELVSFELLTSAHLAQLLPHLTQLHSLCLHALEIDSLAFLVQEPSRSRLTHLDVSFCTRLPLKELAHVHALGGLRSLNLVESFDALMDDLSQQLLTPPSLPLPRLEQFTYEPPESE